MADKNMSELRTIDPNAKTEDGATILHWCAAYAWVDGVKYLFSHETKPDLTIKDNNVGNKVSQFVVKSVPNLCSFEIKRFIILDSGTRIPKI